MKISDEEVNAALDTLKDADSVPYALRHLMRAALKAAYTVRKARKAAKRAKAKPSILDEDQQDAMGQEIPARSYQSWYGNGELLNSAQAVPEPVKPEHRFKVGDRVVHVVFGAGAIKEITNLIQGPYFVAFDGSIGTFCTANELSPEPAKPEWNGKFEVGKSYRMRGGGKAMVCYNNGPLSSDNGTVKYPLVGSGAGVGGLMWTDDGRYNVDNESQFDLIIPWED